jgi:hypothetical protein
MAGALIAQLFVARFLRSSGLVRAGDGQLEHVTAVATMIYYTAFTLLGERLGVRSTYLNAFGASSLLVALIINDLVLGKEGRLNLVSYFIAQVRILFSSSFSENKRGLIPLQFIPTVVGVEGILTFVDIFVPLTGRLGAAAPADCIIASIVGIVGFLSIPMALPFAHRYGERFLIRAVLFLVAASTVIAGVFFHPSWKAYDAEHPKRILSLHMENITTGEFSLHVASLDRMPFHDLISNTTTELGIDTKDLVFEDISTDIPDWE